MVYTSREPLIAVDMENMNVDININMEYSLSTYMCRHGCFPTKIHFGLSYIPSKETHAYQLKSKLEAMQRSFTIYISMYTLVKAPGPPSLVSHPFGSRDFPRFNIFTRLCLYIQLHIPL